MFYNNSDLYNSVTAFTQIPWHFTQITWPWSSELHALSELSRWNSEIVLVSPGPPASGGRHTWGTGFRLEGTSAREEQGPYQLPGHSHPPWPTLSLVPLQAPSCGIGWLNYAISDFWPLILDSSWHPKLDITGFWCAFCDAFIVSKLWPWNSNSKQPLPFL